MKVVGILGSPRGKHSFTRKLLESALDGVRNEGAETEVIDITKLDIQYCKGCSACYKTQSCVIKDDFQSVYNKMLEADGILLSSPVYFNSVSAQLKTFMDRTADCRHCLLLRGKYAMTMTVTASSGAESTLSLMSDYLINNGAFVIGGVSVAIGGDMSRLEKGKEQATAMGRDLVEAIATRRPYPGQAARQDEFVRDFSEVVRKARDYWTGEYEYYVANGWI
jgi:multimeric flavodoxin WrbA